MAHFLYDGHRLDYTEYGEGDRTTVLLPGLLLPRRMQEPLAKELARHGNRVITLDPLGHGTSERPMGMWHYAMPAFARQTVALLDHLELEHAVVGGTSLGANITLEVASLAPGRLQGMVVEMPVLDSAIPACGAAFTPLLLALKLGQPAMGALARGARVVPRWRLPFLLDIGLDWLAQDPGPSADVLGGILMGRVAPDHEERRTFVAPGLVIGHPRDPVHPFSDADMLVEELPNARLVHASSILELRLRPERLMGTIASFVTDCWESGQARPGRTATHAAA
ncbi:MAG: alpha/beta fold hydrolase [Actinomycetota bacterium]|nr:alpha/beta fold hydrolase [Actinomycetota bacterium]